MTRRPPDSETFLSPPLAVGEAGVGARLEKQARKLVRVFPLLLVAIKQLAFARGARIKSDVAAFGQRQFPVSPRQAC
jgi:hypothetical protein